MSKKYDDWDGETSEEYHQKKLAQGKAWAHYRKKLIAPYKYCQLEEESEEEFAAYLIRTGSNWSQR